MHSIYEVTAGEIMDTNVPFVLQHATPKEVASLLSKNKDCNVFPVVNSKGTIRSIELMTHECGEEWLI
jgi:CBS domain-containing protein